jgi:hypothetical protein
MLDDMRLDYVLVDLGRHIAFPPTPDIATSVRARIQPRPAPTRSLIAGFWRQPAVVAALVLLATLAVATVVVPDLRSAVADRIGLRGVTIRQLAGITAPPTVPAATLAQRFGLGEPTTLEAARRRVPFHVLVPDVLGAPDQVFVRDFPPAGQVGFIYLGRPELPAAGNDVGLLLTQFRGDILTTNLFAKGLGPDTLLEEVIVNGRGYWIAGEVHLFVYVDAEGRTQTETFRLARNVLLWEQGGLTLRLEFGGSRDEALRIAASMR